jgi:hypothetical protein
MYTFLGHWLAYWYCFHLMSESDFYWIRHRMEIYPLNAETEWNKCVVCKIFHKSRILWQSRFIKYFAVLNCIFQRHQFLPVPGGLLSFVLQCGRKSIVESRKYWSLCTVPSERHKTWPWRANKLAHCDFQYVVIRHAHARQHAVPNVL